MVFADLLFIYIFLPLFAIFYYKFNKNIVLCIFSIIFYAFGEPIYILLLLFSVFVNFIIGKNIYYRQNNKKLFLIIGIVFNVSIIFIFKYLNLLTSILFSLNIMSFKTEILLPIGISFFTFQSITYIVDVYRGDNKCQDNYMDLLLYISMFPQLIAGPIVRYKTIAEEINYRKVQLEDFLDGAYRFIFGLGKKVIIANQLSVISTELLDSNLESLSKFGAILGIFCFVLQLYFDFSAYSDMAIGMGRCLGFHFEENFNYPLISKSMTEFWRRWHISLGTFFRDYVYIPLGGNRRHQYLNIFIVWLLTGIWHGANVNFIIWGLFLFFVIALEKLFLTKVLDKIPSFISHIYIIIITMISFSIFYFTDTGRLVSFFNIFISDREFFDIISTNLLYSNIFLIIFATLLSTPALKYLLVFIMNFDNNTINNIIIRYSNYFVLFFSIIVLIVSTLLLVGDTINPFLYTRF